MPDFGHLLERLHELIDTVTNRIDERFLRTPEEQRQAFLDHTAQVSLSGLLADPSRDNSIQTCARFAYDAAEALWAERERRRAAREVPPTA